MGVRCYILVIVFFQRDVLSFEIVSFILTFKNLIFVSVFSILCDRFYMSVSEADATCSRLLSCLQRTGKIKYIVINNEEITLENFWFHF